MEAWLMELIWFLCKISLRAFFYANAGLPQEAPRFNSEQTRQMADLAIKVDSHYRHLQPAVEALCGELMLVGSSLFQTDSVPSDERIRAVGNALGFGQGSELLAMADRLYWEMDQHGSHAADPIEASVPP